MGVWSLHDDCSSLFAFLPKWFALISIFNMECFIQKSHQCKVVHPKCLMTKHLTGHTFTIILGVCISGGISRGKVSQDLYLAINDIE